MPELEELFDVIISRVQSSDGQIGTTNTSGAMINPAASVNNITIAENDYPYGLLQFYDGPPPDWDKMVVPHKRNIKVHFTQ